VCGTLNGRMLRDGSLLYGCTCNMSLSTAALRGLAFDTSFSSAAFEARARRGRFRVPRPTAAIPPVAMPRAGHVRHARLPGRRAGRSGHACAERGSVAETQGRAGGQAGLPATGHGKRAHALTPGCHKPHTADYPPNRACARQDVEFCVRARKHDVPLTFCAGAVVAHAFNPGLRGLFRQFLRYGLFERQMCARHPEYLSWLSITTEISSFDVRLAEAGAAAGVRANGGASGPPGPDAAPVAGHAAG